MSQFIKLLVIIVVCVEVSRADRLGVLDAEPYKIEYYGSEDSYPPIKVKLSKDSELSRLIEDLLSEEGWFIGLGGSKVPNLIVGDKDGKYWININPNNVCIHSSSASFWQWCWHNKKINPEIYSRIETLIIEQAKSPKRTRAMWPILGGSLVGIAILLIVKGRRKISVGENKNSSIQESITENNG